MDLMKCSFEQFSFDTLARFWRVFICPGRVLWLIGELIWLSSAG